MLVVVRELELGLDGLAWSGSSGKQHGGAGSYFFSLQATARQVRVLSQTRSQF
jgi:hypothetical protein